MVMRAPLIDDSVTFYPFKDRSAMCKDNLKNFYTKFGMLNQFPFDPGASQLLVICSLHYNTQSLDPLFTKVSSLDYHDSDYSTKTPILYGNGLHIAVVCFATVGHLGKHNVLLDAYGIVWWLCDDLGVHTHTWVDTGQGHVHPGFLLCLLEAKCFSLVLLLKFELPRGYYGNAFVTPAAISKAGLLCSNPLTYAVELVKNIKGHINEEYIRSFADLMVIKGRPELSKSWNFIISDNRSARFDEVDFGWGKPIFGGVPIAISSISFFVPVKYNKGEKGILIAISLPPLAMEKFQQVVYNLIYKNMRGLNIISKI